MAAPIEEVLWTGQKPCIVEKLKVKSGSHIAVGSLLITCKVLDQSNTAKSPNTTQILRLKSSLVGTVHCLYVKAGQTVPPGGLVMTIAPCNHPTVMKDMCADCGADLRVAQGRPGERTQHAAASVAMVHNIPELHVSKEVALELAQHDVKSLLRNRKLVLIVDLDQTIIHTTMKNVPKSLPSVHHFQLIGSGKQFPWYHTKIRPGCRELLEKLTEKFQLHIFTMGSRPYAHTVARILDPEKKLFADRILSRDECFDQNSKTANLSSIFPTGDHMVCIIDDREDVWNFAPNLIHVKPYQYFVDTDDINMPPGVVPPDNPLTLLSAEEGENLGDAEGMERVSCTDQNKNTTIKADNEKSSSLPEEQGQADRTEVGLATNMDIDNNVSEENKEGNKRRRTEEGEPLGTKKEGGIEEQEGETRGIGQTSLEKVSETTDHGTDQVCHVGGGTTGAHADVPGLDSQAGHISQGVGSEEPVRNLKTDAAEDSDPTKEEEEDRETVKQDEENTEQAGEDEGSSNAQITRNKIPVLEGAQLEQAKDIKTDNSDKVEKEMSDIVRPQVSQESSTKPAVALKGPDSDKTDENQNNSVRRASNMSESKESDPESAKEDCTDDYLLYLEDILFRVHDKFFKVFDHFVVKKKDAVPDLKVIIPSIRQKILAGVRMTFSSVFPRNLPPERYRLWNVAISLGAQVTKDFVKNDKSGNKGSWTTHVVAAKTGTSKVNAAKKSRKVHVVTPMWLVACWERWERVDERLYLLTKSSGIQIASGSGRSTPASENEQLPVNKGGLSTKKQLTVPQKALPKGEGDSIKEDESSQMPLSMCDDYNPLYSFSSQDIRAMDKEVEDIFGESSSSDESDHVMGEEETSVHSPSDQSLGSITQEVPSSSDESLTAESPRGWKRKRESGSSESGEDDKDDQSNQPSGDEWLSDKERDEMADAIDDLLSYSTTARSVSTHLTMPKL